MDKNHYLVTMSFYITAKDDADAEYKAKYIAARQHMKNNDNCQIISIIPDNSYTIIKQPKT